MVGAAQPWVPPQESLWAHREQEGGFLGPGPLAEAVRCARGQSARTRGSSATLHLPGEAAATLWSPATGVHGGHTRISAVSPLLRGLRRPLRSPGADKLGRPSL